MVEQLQWVWSFRVGKRRESSRRDLLEEKIMGFLKRREVAGKKERCAVDIGVVLERKGFWLWGCRLLKSEFSGLGSPEGAMAWS